MRRSLTDVPPSGYSGGSSCPCREQDYPRLSCIHFLNIWNEFINANVLIKHDSKENPSSGNPGILRVPEREYSGHFNCHSGGLHARHLSIFLCTGKGGKRSDSGGCKGITAKQGNREKFYGNTKAPSCGVALTTILSVITISLMAAGIGIL